MNLPRTVIILGLASFFTDFSSEMIYPLLPVFLATVLGAGAVQLGLIEGVAESTAAFLKIFSGFWTDRVKRRKPFILWGYSVAGIVRPLIGLAGAWPVVFVLRLIDRVGKGIRTSPRDAMIADVTEPGQRGLAYGFHRSMDHAGAVVGPLAAAALLRGMNLPLREVFLWAAVPAAIVIILLTTLLEESKLSLPPLRGKVQDGGIIVEFAPPTYTSPSRGEEAKMEPALYQRSSWQALGRDFHLFLVIFFIFTLGGSADAFLLLRLGQAGIHASAIALLWSAHHVVKMGSTYWGGRLADHVPVRRLILTGWILYAGVYLGFAWARTPGTLVALFLIYGLYYGVSEPAERVMVSRLAPAPLRGTAFGYFHGTIGLAALPASALFGLVWKLWGPSTAFLTGAALAATASAALVFALNRNPSN